jgi:choice-of-anchor C domain-containing protein
MKKAVVLGIVLLAIACVAGVSAGTGSNIVVNGGFEAPAIEDIIVTLSGGQLIGWNINNGDIQVIKNVYWESHSGSQSIDLSGTVPGKISQTLTTVPGDSYELTFWMSGNPDGTAREQAFKEMQVSWDGAVLSPTYSHDSTETTRQNMGWTRVTIPGLKATSTATVLSFEEIYPNGPYGIVLDDISVVDTSDPVPAPEFPTVAVPAGFIIGLIGIILSVRRSEE